MSIETQVLPPQPVQVPDLFVVSTTSYSYYSALTLMHYIEYARTTVDAQ